MTLVQGGNHNFHAGDFLPDLRHQEEATKDFANSLLNKDIISSDEITAAKSRLQTLERKAALYNAIADTIHRIIMDIIHRMGK